MGSREVVDDDDGNGEAASSGQRRLRREQGRSSAGDKGFVMGFLDGKKQRTGGHRRDSELQQEFRRDGEYGDSEQQAGRRRWRSQVVREVSRRGAASTGRWWWCSTGGRRPAIEG
ncbi:hypothetical protein LXL04_026458 [Taraxacum kok-saghyz]